MTEYFFGLHSGHLRKEANLIAEKHGARHINFSEPRGKRRGWFACPNRGQPFDQAIAEAVMADIEAVGGLDMLRHKRDVLRHAAPRAAPRDYGDDDAEM